MANGLLLFSPLLCRHFNLSFNNILPHALQLSIPPLIPHPTFPPLSHHQFLPFPSLRLSIPSSPPSLHLSFPLLPQIPPSLHLSFPLLPQIPPSVLPSPSLRSLPLSFPSPPSDPSLSPSLPPSVLPSPSLGSLPLSFPPSIPFS